MTDFRFKAFICYSHKNGKVASQLMRQLETYRVPSHLSRSGKKKLKSPKNLGKIFRDREELPASDCLDSKLLDAIKQSEFLIVICSPSSARSLRVNEEIAQFVRHRDSRNILCYIVEGEPQFGTAATLGDQDCVAPALRKLYLQSGQIPVAADARVDGDGETKALLKIVAGLLNVGLDELVQRNAKRQQNRLLTLTATSIMFALLTSGLLVRANLAEKAAQQATLEANLQNERAEELVHFMLEDLAGIKLQQLGRLDVIDAVVKEIADHYSRQDDAKLGSFGLARKAQAYLRLGRVYLGRNMHDPANELFEYSLRTTTSLTQRYPDSREATFAHVRSLYWAGLSKIYTGQYAAAEAAWRERVRYGKILLQSQDHSKIVWSDLGDIYVHLGWALMEMGQFERAYEEFQKGLKLRQENVDRFKDDIGWLNSLAGGHYHVQWAELYLGKNSSAIESAIRSNETYKILTIEDPTDLRARGNYARSLRWRAEAEIASLDFDIAENHLRESIEVHKELIDFEPNNTNFQYQACVSSVLLIEVLLEGGKVDEANQAFKSVCPNLTETLALDHPIVHNRFYGYRYHLAGVNLAVKAGSTTMALEKYEGIAKKFYNETNEIQISPQGKLISLSLAMSAVDLSDQYPLPDLKQTLSWLIEEIETSSVKRHSLTARMVIKAKVMVSNMSANNKPALLKLAQE